MPQNKNESAVGSALGIYGKLFRNPAGMVFFVLFMLLYTVVFLLITAREAIDILEVVKAVPFAVSAFVVGVFSVLFWALNYVARGHKSELKCEETKRLFDIRQSAIDKIFANVTVEDEVHLATLKAHLLLAGGDLSWEPDGPVTSLAFDYGDAVKTILQKS